MRLHSRGASQGWTCYRARPAHTERCPGSLSARRSPGPAQPLSGGLMADCRCRIQYDCRALHRHRGDRTSMTVTAGLGLQNAGPESRRARPWESAWRSRGVLRPSCCTTLGFAIGPGVTPGPCCNAATAGAPVGGCPCRDGI